MEGDFRNSIRSLYGIGRFNKKVDDQKWKQIHLRSIPFSLRREKQNLQALNVPTPKIIQVSLSKNNMNFTWRSSHHSSDSSKLDSSFDDTVILLVARIPVDWNVSLPAVPVMLTKQELEPFLWGIYALKVTYSGVLVKGVQQDLQHRSQTTLRTSFRELTRRFSCLCKWNDIHTTSWLPGTDLINSVWY